MLQQKLRDRKPEKEGYQAFFMGLAKESHESALQIASHHCYHRYGDEAGCARGWSAQCKKGLKMFFSIIEKTKIDLL